MRTGKRIKILTVGLVLMLVAMLGWAMRNKFLHKTSMPAHRTKAVKSDSVDRITYDTVLLKKFADISKAFNVQKDVVTYSGVVNVNDGADSTNNVKALNFYYSRNGSNYYYKNGSTETLNAQGLYIYIEHDRKRILIAKQKEVQTAPLPDMTNVPDKLRSERYRLVDKMNGGYETIALLNEHHITCKEYAITFDTLHHQLNTVITRLSCFADPLNKKKDKVISMTINQYESRADAANFPDKSNTVLKDGDGWKLTAKYSNYELISLP
jgi:hypothetical protein